MELKFRDLRADEIECRVANVIDSPKFKGVSLLLYKDARCDMNILDEAVGAMNWQRSHARDNANCIVSIWDEDKKQWIAKEDTGTESNTEAEKGLASDSFKRACFNWGIGRELYTAPSIVVSADDCNITDNSKSGRKQCNDKFTVESITIENKKIVALSIKNNKTGAVVYTFGGKKAPAKKSAPKKVAPTGDVEPNSGEAMEAPAEQTPVEKFPNRNKFLKLCADNGIDYKPICVKLKLNSNSKDVDFLPAVTEAVKRIAEKDKKETGVELPFPLE